MHEISQLTATKVKYLMVLGDWTATANPCVIPRYNAATYLCAQNLLLACYS